MNAKYILWDFDGTLAQRCGMWRSTLIEVLERELPGLGVSTDQIRPYMQTGFPWHSPDIAHTHLQDPEAWWMAVQPVFVQAYRAVGIADPQAQKLAGMVREQYLDLEKWSLFEDTFSALEQLSGAGWRHAILSNHVPELPWLVERLGLLPWFDHIFNSAVMGYEKPHPRAFEIALEGLGPTGQVCMIGDSYQSDIMGAARSGIPGYLVHKAQAGVTGYPDLNCAARAIINRFPSP